MLKKLGKLEEIIQNENISVNKIKDTEAGSTNISNGRNKPKSRKT